MLDAWIAVPGDLQTRTGGYAYARALLQRLPGAGVHPHHVQLPSAYPFPDANDIAETTRLFQLVPDNAPLLIDGLAYGAFPDCLAAALPQPIVALIHHPLAFESGLDADIARRLAASERAALRHADGVVTTSSTTAETLVTHYEVSRSKLTVAEPGAPPARRAPGSGSEAVHLLAVGSISPRKGLNVLVDALAPLAGLDWRLTIVGSTGRDPAATAALQTQIADAGLDNRIELTGEFGDEAIELAFARADVFVHPALYEGYGMVLTEALSRGLPIVASTGGAAAVTVPDNAALKVSPGDTEELREALEQVISYPGERKRLSEASWEAAQSLPTWDDTAVAVAGVLKAVVITR